jgi:hypothetical protein
MKTISLPFVLLTLTLIASAADSKPVTNRDGNCVLSVPSNWNVDPGMGIASSPDKKISVVVSSPSHGLSTLAQVEQMAPTVYTNDKVTKSSSSEFEMEGASINGKPNFYRAVPAGAKVCIADLSYETGTPASAKAIIGTLKSK